VRDSKRTRRWSPRTPRAESYNAVKARLQNDVAIHALKAGLPRPVPGPAWLSFLWCEAERRRDPDNVRAGGTKIILDGLVQAKVLPKDGVRDVVRFAGDDYEYGARVGVVVTVGVQALVWRFFFPHRLPELGELLRAEARGARRGG